MTSSVRMITFPIYGKIIQMFQTTNQLRIENHRTGPWLPVDHRLSEGSSSMAMFHYRRVPSRLVKGHSMRIKIQATSRLGYNIFDLHVLVEPLDSLPTNIGIFLQNFITFITRSDYHFFMYLEDLSGKKSRFKLLATIASFAHPEGQEPWSAEGS